MTSDAPAGRVAPLAPLLSVCIPTHHGRRELLEQALESIAPQVTPALSAAIELVVSDNASRDGTDAMIAAFRARHPQLALVYGRNERDVRLLNIMRAVERASGEWCWLFGSDDLMAEDGLATVTAAIARHPRASGIAFAKQNFSHDMTQVLGQDPPRFFPSATGETVYETFEAIVGELAFQHAYLGTNVVRRARWLAAAERAGDDVARRHPDWPQLVVLADMARRDPVWAWLPHVLVKARAGRPYLVDPDAEEANLAQMHVTLVDGLRDVWPQIAARGTPLHRELLRKSYAVAASDEVVRNLKLQRGQTLGRDLGMLRSFTRAFWRLPEFRRHCLAPLLVPAAVGRALAPARRSMKPLQAPQFATELSVTLAAPLHARATVGVECDVTNRGDRELRRGDPNPVALGFRWFDGAGKLVMAADRAQLPRSLRPGQTARIHGRVNAPWEPGDYELRIALVQEHVAWFDDVDPANGARLPVRLVLPGGA